MSKEIRVLTGFHAGAQIELSTATMSIGATPDADILINDWSERTMQLTLDAQHHLAIGVPGDPSAAVPMDDFAPRRFGDVVLCAGPAAAPWPPDLHLLESMLAARHEGRKYDGEASDGIYPAAPVSPPVVARTRRVPWVQAGVAALLIGSAGAAAMVVPTSGSSLAADRPQMRITLGDLKQVLARFDEPDLAIDRRADGFVVTGVASTTAGARTVHDALAALVGGRLRWNVEPGDAIAGALAESLHDPGVRVRYAGGRRFVVTGAARRPDEVRDIADRFRNDMGPLVAHVDVDVTRTDALQVAGDVDSVLSADGTHYVESSDGTKNFVADAPMGATLH